MKEGYVLCDKCNGDRVVLDENKIANICNKCWGCGNLDWIEVVVGKPFPFSWVDAGTTRGDHNHSQLWTTRVVE